MLFLREYLGIASFPDPKNSFGSWQSQILKAFPLGISNLGGDSQLPKKFLGSGKLAIPRNLPNKLANWSTKLTLHTLRTRVGMPMSVCNRKCRLGLNRYDCTFLDNPQTYEPVLVAYALDLVGRRSEQQLEVKCA